MILDNLVVDNILVDCASVKINQYNDTTNPTSRKQFESEIETILWIATRMGFTSKKEVYEGKIVRIVIGDCGNEFE